MIKSFYRVVFLALIFSVLLNFVYYFLNRLNPNPESDLTFIGLVGLLIFIPFIFFKPVYLKNCFSTVIFVGLILYMPMILIKFDIINLAVILLYMNFINYIICSRGRRKIEERD